MAFASNGKGRLCGKLFLRQGVTLEVLDKADGHFLETRSRILDVEDQRGRRTGLGERLDQRDLKAESRLPIDTRPS